MADRLYLDSCCFIALVKGEPEGRLVADALQQVEMGAWELWASTLVYAEVARANDTVNAFLRPPRIRYVEVGLRIAESARVVINQTGVGGADAVHVATALLVDCQMLFTTDERMLKADGYEGLKVCRPEHLPGQQSLGVN